ncbi:hypothetical protein [Breoghania sp.]|uniref:hypothetical protein n=1 Tax=Breoghania sp. TaxID=2065378 RepID=UPI00260BF36F|nr:hypothetical protein [Breoghania sp.]MDJ0931294.1 hypothetical protein [Breoghania sp.]
MLDFLAAIEIEAVTRAGHLKAAQRQLAEHRGKYLSKEQVRDAEEAITAITANEEVECYRQRYEAEKKISDLRLLVASLSLRRDWWLRPSRAGRSTGWGG